MNDDLNVSFCCWRKKQKNKLLFWRVPSFEASARARVFFRIKASGGGPRSGVMTAARVPTGESLTTWGAPGTMGGQPPRAGRTVLIFIPVNPPAHAPPFVSINRDWNGDLTTFRCVLPSKEHLRANLRRGNLQVYHLFVILFVFYRRVSRKQNAPVKQVNVFMDFYDLETFVCFDQRRFKLFMWPQLKDPLINKQTNK